MREPAVDPAPTGRPSVDDFVDALRRPRAMSVLAAVVAAILVAGIAVGMLRGGTGVYESRSLLLVDQTNAVVAAESDGVLAKLNAVRAKYAALARSRTIVEPVADAVGVPVGVVAGSLFVDGASASLTLSVGARTADPKLSQQIATAGAA